jgi:hypothetical protein
MKSKCRSVDTPYHEEIKAGFYKITQSRVIHIGQMEPSLFLGTLRHRSPSWGMASECYGNRRLSTTGTQVVQVLQWAAKKVAEYR